MSDVHKGAVSTSVNDVYNYERSSIWTAEMGHFLERLEKSYQDHIPVGTGT